MLLCFEKMKMKVRFFFLLAAVFWSVNISAATLTIGLPNNLLSQFWVGTLGPTLDALRKALPQHRIVSKEFSPEQLSDSLDKLGIDFFVGSPFLFWGNVFKEGASALATQKPLISTNLGLSTAGVVVVPKKSDVNTLSEAFKGKRFVVTSFSGSDEWTALKAHLSDRRIKLDENIADLREVGQRNPGVVAALISGVADAGLLGFCELEKLERLGIVEPGDLRVIEPLEEGPSFCRRTTALYPGFIFGALSHVDSSTATEVASALYRIQHLPSGDLWEKPASFGAVDKATRILEMGPYAYLKEWSFEALWKRYSQIIICVSVGFLLLLIHVARVNYLVTIRTRHLKLALEENKQLENRARASSVRILTLEKVSAINHLSSVLAHELKQPIGTISNFVSGLQLSLERNAEADSEEVKFVLAKIKVQAEKVSQLIGFVRKYAKKNDESLYDFKECDLNEVVEKAVESAKFNFPDCCSIEVKRGEELSSYADAVGLELVVFNLIKNAFEAVNPKSGGKITIRTFGDTQFNYIDVEDNGVKLPAETFHQLCTPLNSIKDGGLGLGITITRNILEKFGGVLTYKQKEDEGLIATIRLPRGKNGNKADS